MSAEMETYESQSAVDIDALEVDEPDIGFQVGVGVFCGTVLAGIVTTMLAAAGADVATLFGSFPTAVTGGILVGAILSRRARGFPERLGARRFRVLYGLGPAAVFAVVAAVGAFTPALGGGVAVASLLSAVVSALAGLLVVTMARNRYVDAITTDEPVAIWRLERVGVLRWEYALGGAFVVFGAVQLYWGTNRRAAAWFGYGALLLVLTAGQDRWFDGWYSEDTTNAFTPDLAVHDAGLVKSQGRTKTLVPWSEIRGVELTDDELVIERRLWNVRCGTDPIDDPKAVYETIEARCRE
ncbi:PH domain-containing protein [Halobacteria archaeon AArc-m2/3/4]|uniref:PH domain-containing protein n=1 Tax=Natronoglomus mannanivorans TaxID=2979990 RepID=A0ABT2QBR2_9EURY|nr:PH domain-containing protein [Halobacteria archaeon AArc-m2/3/4]